MWEELSPDPAELADDEMVGGEPGAVKKSA
jgi:hypothetical protein